MTSTADAYYAELARDYDRVIRQLVPRYDDMLAAVVDALQGADPARLLELGTGTGGLAARVLEALPTAVVTAVDVAPAMVARARRRLGRFRQRARVVRADLAADPLPAGAPWDAVFTNLVLHNLDAAGKREVLTALRAALVPGAPFVWGDMITFDDPALLHRAVAFRRAFAVECGCRPDLVRWNFDKEAREDHPLTVEATVALAREAGFDHPDVAWAHDQFAVVTFRA